MVLRLADGVSVRHIFAFYFCNFMTILSYTFVNAAQPTVLRDIIQVPPDQRGRKSGDMNFYGELLIIATVTWFGVISDKVGRRVVYTFGMLMMAAGLLLYPYAESYLMLVGFRLLFAVGASSAAAMMTAVLSDYVDNADKGKAAGLMGLTSGLGAVTAAVGLLSIPAWVGDGEDAVTGVRAMYMAGAGAMVAAALGATLLAGPSDVQVANSHVGLHCLLADGFRAARKDPNLGLAYFAGFVARGDSIVLTLWMSQWVNDFVSDRGGSSATAAAKAGMVTGIAQTCALVCAPFCGLLAHRAGPVRGLVLVCVVAVIGYAGICGVNDPTSGIGLLFACIVGFGEIGVVVISQGFVSQRAPKQIRGAVAGTFGLCGSLGILTGTKVGGVLYDKVHHPGPFCLFAVFTALVALAACVAWGLGDRGEPCSQTLLAGRDSSQEDGAA